MFYNQIKPFKVVFPNPIYECKSHLKYLTGFSRQLIVIPDVSVLSVDPLAAKWDLGLTTAVSDVAISNSIAAALLEAVPLPAQL